MKSIIVILVLLISAPLFSSQTYYWDYYGTCDFTALATACSNAAIQYGTCVSQVTPPPTNYDDIEAYLVEMYSYLGEVCDCINPYLYCWMHSGHCDALGEYINTFNPYCFGSCFTTPSPTASAVCDGSRWFVDGDYTVGSGAVFDATAGVEFGSSLTVDAESTIRVSVYYSIVAPSITISGSIVVYISDQVSLDYIAYSFRVEEGKRALSQTGDQKIVVLAEGSNLSVDDSENFTIEYGVDPCATFEATLVTNSTHAFLVLDNYDDSACSDNYDDYIAPPETMDTSASVSYLIAPILAATALLF